MPVTLPVEASVLAARIGLSVRDASHRTLIEGAILDAQADVEAHLNRPVMPVEYVEAHRYDTGNGWSLTPLDTPVRSIVSAVPETIGDPPVPTGYFTVTYTAGLDCRDPDKRPILRYITAHAMNAPEVVRLWEQHSSQDRSVTGVSVEGQGISYAPATLGGGGAAGSGAPGALPTLSSLDKWRRVSVFVRRTPHAGDEAWPYNNRLWSRTW